MKLLIWDFSRTILFPKNKAYMGGLNSLYDMSVNPKTSELFVLDQEILDFVKAHKDTIPSVIFTTGDVQNDEWIQEQLKGLFLGIENVESIGFEKTSKEAYLELCRRYEVNPGESIFIDDQIANTNAANEAGLKIINHKDNQSTFKQILEWIS